jgi:hypothetical protein
VFCAADYLIAAAKHRSNNGVRSLRSVWRSWSCEQSATFGVHVCIEMML